VDTESEREFREYVAGHFERLHRMAYLLTASRVDAEDLVQSALIRTYSSWRVIRSRESVDAYVYRVMVNLRRARWRRRRVLEQQLPVDVAEQRTSGFDQVDMHDALWRAVISLPRRQRAAVVLRYYEELSEREAAEVLGCTVGTVKSQTAKALRALRAQLVEGIYGSDDIRLTLPVVVSKGDLT
jgi:RNA polymerase sigma-70 factor (sigma-E family)